MSDNYEFELTADEIEELDELDCDTRALEATTKRTLAYLTNRQNELNKQQQKWWKRVMAPRGYNPKFDRLRVDRMRGKVVVVTDKEDDE